MSKPGVCALAALTCVLAACSAETEQAQNVTYNGVDLRVKVSTNPSEAGRAWFEFREDGDSCTFGANTATGETQCQRANEADWGDITLNGVTLTEKIRQSCVGVSGSCFTYELTADQRYEYAYCGYLTESSIGPVGSPSDPICADSDASADPPHNWDSFETEPILVVASGDIQADCDQTPAPPALDPCDAVPPQTDGVGHQSESAFNINENRLDATPHDLILTLGDHQYESGALTLFEDHYAETWGEPADKAKTFPAPGNHDHLSTGIHDNYCVYFGSGAGIADPCPATPENDRPSYAFTKANWRFYSLDTGTSTETGGDLTGAQHDWLDADLGADDHACEIVYWHHPLYSAGLSHGDNAALDDDWAMLMDRKVDLVLSGHEHNYQSWKRMNSTNQVDNTNGIRQIIAGAGGKSHHGFDPDPPTQRTGVDDYSPFFGILKLTLGDDYYVWQFLKHDTGAVLDSGFEGCRS